MQTGASDPFFLEERDCLSLLGKLKGRGIAARAATDYQRVKFLHFIPLNQGKKSNLSYMGTKCFSNLIPASSKVVATALSTSARAKGACERSSFNPVMNAISDSGKRDFHP